MRFLPGHRLLPLLLAAVPAFFGSLPASAASTVQTALPDSVQTVDDVPPTAAEPHKAYISRRTLRTSETAQVVNFEVALQTPNFTELQTRVANGEQISNAEMDAKYRPATADYQKIVDWLTEQGFTVQKQDSGRIAVFASGRVDQIQNRLGAKFARVKADGDEYTSAISAPSVPAELAPLLIGINGLQPHLRMHRHSIVLNSTSGAGEPYEPSQIAQAYDASSLYTAGITGTGHTIAIVIDTFPLTSDLATFWSSYGVNRGTSTVTFIQAVAGTLPAPSGEESLDTEWSSSIAPGANVRVYATKDLAFADLDAGYAQVYADVTASTPVPIHEMTMSYGAAEYYVSHSQLATDDHYFAELAAAGVTIFASSGDDGAAPTTSGTGGGKHLTPEAPSSDPYVTGVGGTSLTVNSNGTESTETAWNDAYGTNGAGASGGGISTYFAKPSWQTGSTLPSSTMRLAPDVSCPADPLNGAYVTLNGTAYIFGGTSWSSPTWAGFAALLNQSRTAVNLSTLGLLNPYLYPLVGTTNFRDITSGNNKYEGGSGYSCATGYDLVTGCGSPDVAILAQTLTASAVKATAPSLTSVASVQSHAGTPYSIELPVTGDEGVECRAISNSLQIVFTFNGAITSASIGISADGTANLNGAATFSGDTMTVNLSGVTDIQNITLTASKLNGTSSSVSVTFGVLVGDVNGDGNVDALDLIAIRNTLGADSGDSAYEPEADITEDGTIDALDLIQVRNHLGNGLP